MKLKLITVALVATLFTGMTMDVMSQERELRAKYDCMSKVDRLRIAAKFGFQFINAQTIEGGEVLTTWRHVENGNLIFTVEKDNTSCVVGVGIDPVKEF